MSTKKFHVTLMIIMGTITTASKEFDTMPEALAGVEELTKTMPAEVGDNYFVIIGEKNPLESFDLGRPVATIH